MVVPDLKLVVSVDMGKLGQIPADIKKANDASNAENQRAANETLRIQKQAAQAEAALVLDKFDRRIAVEKVKHDQILANLKANDSAQEAEIRRHTALVARLQMDKANLPNTPFQQLLGGMTQSMGLADGAMGMAGMAAGALGATLAITKLGEAIHGTVEAAMDMQTIHQTLDFASGSAKQGAEDFRFLQIQAQTLGISMRDSAPEFARMEAAAMGTSMAGKGVKDIFKSMSEAAVTLHMNTDMASRGFYALQEMMSMGSVQTRQLRMLSLSLPGAFQDAAKAMGVTTEEMMKMMAHGKVMTDDFLPKFAEVMREKYEKPSVDASTNARQEIQKFKNAMFEDSAAIGESFLKIEAAGAHAYLALSGYGTEAADTAKKVREEILRLQEVQEKQTGSRAISAEMEIQARKNAAALKVAAAMDAINANRPDPQSGPKADTDQQIENQVKLEEELQVALAAAREDGEAKKVAEENRRFTKEKEHLFGSHKEVELAEQIHTTNLAAIHSEYAKKAKEEADKEAGERFQQIRDSEKKQQAFLVDSNLAARAELERLKKKNGSAEVADKLGSGKDPGAQMADRHSQLESDRQEELKVLQEKFGDTEYANEIIFEINRKYSDKTIALKREEAKLEQQAIAGTAKITSEGLGVIMGLYHKHGAEYKAWAQAKNAVDTSMAAMAAYESAASIPYVGWLMGPVAAGVAVAAGLENASKINSAQFYTGGYTGYGDPRDPAGIVHKDEYVVDHSTLAKAGGPAGVQRALNSPSSGTTQSWSPVINVHMAPGTTAADAHAIADTIDSRLRNLAKDLKEIDYRGIRA